MKYLDFFKYRTPSGDVVDRCWKGSIDMHIHFEKVTVTSK
jgi:hypothetical protein